MGAVLEVTDGTFEQEVLKSDTPVLVDFWAPGCPPCAALAPVLEKLAGELAGKAKFVKVNAAQERASAARAPISTVQASRPVALNSRGLSNTLRQNMHSTLKA